MCVLIYKPEGVEFVESDLQLARDNNQDGVGCGWLVNGEFAWFKTQADALFGNIYSTTKEYPSIVHFRHAMSGDNSLNAVMPFRVWDYLFAHVGVLREFPSLESKSDSRQFVEEVLKKDDFDPFTDSGLLKIMNGYCSVTRNRMVFLRNDGVVRILGEKQGYWKHGCWYSGAILE